MSKLRLEGQLEVDTKQALQQTTKEAGAAFDKIDKEAEDTKKNTTKSFDQIKEAAKSRFGAIKTAAIAVFGAVGAAAGAVFAAGKLAEAGANVVAGMDTIKALGVSEEGLRRINDALQGTVDRLTIATSLKPAAIANLGEENLARLAKTASFIAVKMGESKVETLKLAAAAQLTDDQLSQIGLSTLHLEAQVAKASAEVGRTLSEREQRRIKLLTILQASAKATNNFTADTKDAGDAAARVFAEFTNIKNELLREILPLVNDFLRKVTDVVRSARLGVDVLRRGSKQVLESKQVEIFSRDVRNAFANLRQDAAAAAKDTNVQLGGAFNMLQQSLSRVAETVGPESKKVFETVFGTPAKAKAALAAWRELEQLQARNALQGKAVVSILDKMTATSNNLIKVNLKGVDALREASEELRGFQSEARNLLRNYERTFSALLGSMGGTFSGVVSSLQDAFEKFRVLGSLGNLRAGLEKTLKLSVDQIEAQKEQLRLSEQQVKAAKLMAVARQAGELDRRERIGTEQAVNRSLRAGLSTLAAQQKIQQNLIEQFNQRKDVTASEITVSLLRSALAARVAKLEERITAARAKGFRGTVRRLALERDFLDGQLQRLNATRAAYAAIAKERQGLLKIQEQQARIELTTELAKRNLDAEKGRVDAMTRVVNLQREIIALQGRASPDVDAAIKAQQAIKAIQLELKDLGIEARDVGARLKGNLFAFAEERTLAAQRLADIQKTIAARRVEIELIKARRDAQIQLAKQARGDELARNQLARQRDLNAEMARFADLQHQVSLAGFAPTPQDAVIKAAADQLRVLRGEVASMNQEASILKRQLSTLQFATPEQRAELQGQLAVLLRRIELRKAEIGLVHQRRDAELQALTVIGNFQRTLYAEAVQFSARFAGSLKGAVDSAVSGIATILADVFAGLVTGADNLGQTVAKGFLDMLAGVSAQLGGFLLLAGTGLVAALIPSGAVAIGAGIGLIALAGVLKGASSLLSAPAPTAPAVAPTLATPDRGLPGPTTPVTEPRETFIAVVSPDWNGTQEQQARKFYDWMRRNGRVTRKALG